MSKKTNDVLSPYKVHKDRLDQVLEVGDEVYFTFYGNDNIEIGEIAKITNDWVYVETGGAWPNSARISESRVPKRIVKINKK